MKSLIIIVSLLLLVLHASAQNGPVDHKSTVTPTNEIVLVEVDLLKIENAILTIEKHTAELAVLQAQARTVQNNIAAAESLFSVRFNEVCKVNNLDPAKYKFDRANKKITLTEEKK